MTIIPLIMLLTTFKTVVQADSKFCCRGVGGGGGWGVGVERLRAPGFLRGMACVGHGLPSLGANSI